MRTENLNSQQTSDSLEMPLLDSVIGQNQGCRDLLNLIPIPIYFKDREGRYQGCNAAFANFAAMPMEKFSGQNVFAIWPEQEASRFVSDDNELFAHPRTHVLDATITPGNGEKREVRIYKTPLKDHDGTVKGLMGAVIDLTDKAAEEKRLRRLAGRDELTGLANRREGTRQLRQIFSHSSRMGRTFSLAMIDVDCFKAINDLHGHLRGDEALRQIAELIQVTLRDYDVVFRYGGDEFIVCLQDTDKSKALNAANRVLQGIEAHFARAVEWKQPVTVSIGIACYPEDARTLSALIGEADCAMYQAKRAGRNRAISALGLAG